IRLGNADVSADGVLADLVDYQFLRNLGAVEVEEDRLVYGAILLLELAVFGCQVNAEAACLLAHALEFDGDIAHLLRLVLAGDGELDVVTLAEATELIDFIVVARD